MRNKNDSGIKFNGMAKLRNMVLINDDFNKNIKNWSLGWWEDCVKPVNKIRATTNFD